MGTKVIRGRKKGSQETSYFLSHGDAVIMGSGNSKKTLTTKIGEIDAVIPEGASSSNKLATAANITSVSGAIDGINAKIPAVASAQNQLADKNFVNSSISTATATFRGTFNLVSDLNLSIGASHAQVATALGTAVSGEDNNDYAFVQIPTAATTPTEIASIDRYKFDGTNWSYEYTLNNSGFTAAQWAAINSGITSRGVTFSHTDSTGVQTTSIGVTGIQISEHNNPDDPYFNVSALLSLSGLEFRNGDASASIDRYKINQIDTVLENFDGKADKVSGATNGHIAGLDANGNPTDSGIAATDVAKKSEMSVTPGTGANADKTTIQLKSGTSATVLNAHQSISGKEDTSNKVTSFNNPTDTQYPSAKLVKDQLDLKAASADLGGYEFDEVDMDTLLS